MNYDECGNFNGLDTSKYVFEKNLQGDVIGIYNDLGRLVAQYRYDAWGNCMITQNVGGMATFNAIRYRGYYYDTETGLYYLKSRYYDPNTGRFINADIFINNEIRILGCNLFSYCINNPIMFIDSNGFDPLSFSFSHNSIILTGDRSVETVYGKITVSVSIEITINDLANFNIFGADFKLTSSDLTITLSNGNSFSFEFDYKSINLASYSKTLFGHEDFNISAKTSKDGLGVEFSSDFKCITGSISISYAPTVRQAAAFAGSILTSPVTSSMFIISPTASRISILGIIEGGDGMRPLLLYDSMK